LDIKLKSCKPFYVWLCFFIGFNIVAFSILFGLAIAEDLSSFDMTILGSDIKETQEFKHDIALKFDILARYIANAADENENSGEQIMNLEAEGENLIYYAKNPNTGKIVTNAESDLGIAVKGFPSLPEGYDFYIYFNGEKFIAENDGEQIDIYRNDSGYKYTLLSKYMDGAGLSATRKNKVDNTIYVVIKDSVMNTQTPTVSTEGELAIDVDDLEKKIRIAAGEDRYYDSPDITGFHIFLVVKQDLVENPYAVSELYRIQRNAVIIKIVLCCAAAVLLLGVALLIFSIIKRKHKVEFDKKVAMMFGKIYFELKAFISIIVLLCLMVSLARYFYLSNGDSVSSLVVIILFICACFWWMYFIWWDIRVNGRSFFTKNTINWAIKKYRSFERRRPFQKAMLLRPYAIIVIEAVLVLFTVISFLILIGGGEEIYIIPTLTFPGIGIYLLYRYMRRYTATIDDIAKVIDHTELIKSGDMTTKLFLSPDADLYILQENLNQIQEGVSKAAEDKLKSERMKVELITNISHDLKTPLTSIISYVDLLSKEEGLPEHVKDFIKILATKSERLKILIQDLFDLSKATSGNMELHIERLDLGKLIEQTLGDLNEQISASPLTFRVNIPDEPVFIKSDGKKLYRVFLNLFQNALKYSLAGSRVYVDLVTDSDKAVVIIKNTSNYEMNFSGEEIVERFVRGDKARSSEGSGLGLAIAQSFTQACGGSFDVKVDGDLFKVVLSFELER